MTFSHKLTQERLMAKKKLILADWILLKRMTKQKLGEILGYNYSYISQITSSRRIPPKFGKVFVEKFGLQEAGQIEEFTDFLKTYKG